jgi:hypothetical protein
MRMRAPHLSVGESPVAWAWGFSISVASTSFLITGRHTRRKRKQHAICSCCRSPQEQSINPSGLVEIETKNRNPTRVAARIHGAGAQSPLLVFDLSQSPIPVLVAVFLLGLFFRIFFRVFFFISGSRGLGDFAAGGRCIPPSFCVFDFH